ncbi:MAG: hypothetical protein H6Q59_1859, partial [Firmicutes bacterium]|nr:hypothetical protein [Bacillota bacterium]
GMVQITFSTVILALENKLEDIE